MTTSKPGLFFSILIISCFLGGMTGLRQAYLRFNFGQIQAEIKAILQEFISFD